jgi:ATP synthase protein I
MTNPHDSDRPEGDDGGKSRSRDLAARIARERAEQEPTHQRPAEASGALSGVSRAYRLAAEFVAAIIVGGALGYAIDFFAGTRPWGMVILLLAGFAAGILNVVRATAEMNAATAVPPGTPAVEDDDDD